MNVFVFLTELSMKFDEGYYRSDVTGGILMCQRQFGKNAPLKPEKYDCFQYCPYLFTHLSLKLGTSIPTKIHCGISKTIAIISQSFDVL